MDTTTLTLLGAGLFSLGFWGRSSLSLSLYNCHTEVRRNQRPLPQRSSARLDGARRRARKIRGMALRQIARPDSDPSDPEAVIKAQFWHFHGWNRYVIPLTIVVVLSGLMLAFSGVWLADYLTTPKDAGQNNNRANQCCRWTWRPATTAPGVASIVRRLQIRLRH